ncbi:hypothetical protein L7F22_040995 [Adiantum nelumboides]|nr:hypothetical protein [Adiantum nelumboides]
MGDDMKTDGAFIGQDASVTPLIGKLRLLIQGYVDKEEIFISPLKHEDVILGAPWFDRLVASIKFPKRKISFKFKGKYIYISVQESDSTIPLVNDQAFDKSIKSSISAYMVFVKVALSDVNETKVDKREIYESLELSKFLNQVQDVFIDDIYGELPPKRGDNDHAIKLLPGSSPPNKPLYRVSQAQQEEIMKQVNELVEKGMPWDLEVGKWLRKQNVSIPVVLIVNKAEGLQSDATGMLLATLGEAHSLGFGDPLPISAETGEGVTDLYATLRPLLAKAQEYINATKELSADEACEGSLPLQLAIAGRPNVGKSTILNSLLREERVLTGPEPGLTRDAVRVKFKYDNKSVYLVDTAGWMQRAQITEGPAALSAMHARRSLMRSNIVVLVLDGQEIAKARKSMLQSEVALARWVTLEGRGLVVVVNKMDLLKGKEQAELRNKVMKAVPEEINKILPQVDGIPIVFVSALEGKGRAAIMRKVFESYRRWNVRLPTAKLNNWLRKVLSRHPRKAEGGHGPKMRYITQVKARPPTFVVFVTGAGDIQETDLRFVASAMREDFDLGGIPIRVIPRHTRRGLRALDNSKSNPRKLLRTKSQGSQLPSIKRTGVD